LRFPSKVHPKTEVQTPRSEVVGNGVLLRKNGFDPGIAGLILHLHKVENFQAKPALP
jgi:hypothetical protein